VGHNLRLSEDFTVDESAGLDLSDTQLVRPAIAREVMETAHVYPCDNEVAVQIQLLKVLR